jgi:valyl-tRNA synthetase
VDEAVGDLVALVRGVRNLRTEAGIAASAWMPLVIEPAGGGQAADLERELAYIEALARVRPIELAGAGTRQRPDLVTAGRLGVAWLDRDAGTDAAGASRRSAQLDEVERNVTRLEELLANRAFVERAPAEVVERERARLADLREQRARLADDGGGQAGA